MNQILHRVDSLICPPNNWQSSSMNLKAIMALDHRRLIRSGKKIRPNFLRSTSLLMLYLTKSCQQIWVPENQPFIPFIHSFFFYKNIFYKNSEAEICEILRIL